jgi:uncharacterized protein DUF6519
MSSDRSRISYDERRRYRSVVTQQGRVTLEADSNEDRTISGELLRAETLDIVGPSGTPNDGFAVLPQTAPTTPSYDIEIGPGTLYVGGERVELGDTLWYSAQTEWLDHDADPDWVDPDSPANSDQANELVYLYLEEHEVGAVEDTALLEVALGGPDTAQRTRLVERIKRLGTDGDTCADAMQDAVTAWANEGLQRDAATQRLLSSATLQVSYRDPGSSGDLCEPDAQGGYLGAENQLIRVEISEAGSESQLLWGFDNASFIYRVQVDADLQTLTLASVPVDDAHKPRTGQAIEVLRTAAQLETGWDSAHEPSPDDFVAAATGVVQTLTSNYDSDTQQIVLPTALPADYGDTNATPVVFLRVWEEELPFTPGSGTDLGSTGITVTIDSPAGFHVGDFWQIGVRPKTPAEVYPERYLDQPQPPDGPRLWASPLAVVQWVNGVLGVLEDCRNPFDNLVDLTKRRQSGCCDILVRPEDLTAGKTLQSILDSFAGRPATICLAPGEYILEAPIRLGPQHTGLTIEACHGDAVLTADVKALRSFAQGLIVLDHANEITLDGLRLHLPRVPFEEAGFKLAGKEAEQLQKQLHGQLLRLFLSIGIRAVQSNMLTVGDCLFLFTTTAQQDVFGAGLFLGGECFGLNVEHCWFASDETFQEAARPKLRVEIGILQAPTASLAGGGGTLVQSRLEDALIRDCHFSGLTAASFIYADCGVTEVEDNTVRLTEVGFVFVEAGTVAGAALGNATSQTLASGASAELKKLVGTLNFVLDPLILLTVFLATAYPWPSGADPGTEIEVTRAELTRRIAKRSQPSWEMIERANSLFGDRAADLPDAKKLQRAETGFTMTSTQLSQLADEYLQIARLEREALLKGQKQGYELSLRFEDNDVDVRVANLTSGPTLLVWVAARENDSALVIDGNRLASQSGTLGTVMGVFLAHTAISGNVIENASVRGTSLIAVPGALSSPAGAVSEGIAVTGNICYGRTILPQRPLAAPLETWDVFNAVTIT